jgi:uncharacterized protein
MSKLITFSIGLIGILFSISAFAWTVPPSPKPLSAISDASGVLTADAHERLDAKLKDINAKTDNEYAALIVPSLDGEEISDVGFATARAWGVGKKGTDNGVLVIIAMKEHKTRIEVGKGVEGDLPDLMARQILQNTLKPHLKDHDVEGGLGATFDAIDAAIVSHKAEPAVSKTSDNTFFMVFVPVLLIFILAWVALIYFIRRSQEKTSNLLRDRGWKEREPVFTHSTSSYVVPAIGSSTTMYAPVKTKKSTANNASTYTYTSITTSPISYNDSSDDSDSSSSSGSSDWGGGSDFGGGSFGGGGASGDF